MQQAAVAIEVERLAIARPVGRFEAALRNVKGGTVARINGSGLEKTVKGRVRGSERSGWLAGEFHVGKNGTLGDVRIVATDSDTDVKRLFQCDLWRCGAGAQLAVVAGQPHREVVSMFFNAQPHWIPVRGLHFAREAGFFRAELDGGHAVSMPGDVGVNRIGVETLSDH